jgi:seryl-tRNA synthetase
VIALQRIRDEPELIREGARLKGEPAPVDEILELDERARGLRAEMEALRAEQNRESKEIRGRPTDEQRERLAGFKRRIQEDEEALGALEASLQALLLVVPNPPHPSVPVGTSDADNVTVRTWGERAEFAFTPRPHHELGEALGIFDFERAAKISGARFAVLRGDGARLQRALITYMLDLATTRHGYSEVAPPYLVRREAMVGTGNLPKFEDDAFHTDGDMFLIPTAEVPVTNLYREEILDGELLPIRHVAYTPCWRREAGAAGKDTRGYVRLHQFDKVELVKFVEPEGSLDELEGLVADAEAVLQGLGIHYRVLLMCTGDMGFAQWKKYDLEAWCPGMQRWLEVSSCSVFADFQARRADIRYRPEAQARPRFVHTLNGSALAVPRTFDAVLENNQQADGSVIIPEALRGYMGGQERLSPK